MTHRAFVRAAAAVFGLGIVALAGCGGGSNGGGGGNTTPPTISAFSTNPAIVTDGSTAALTAVFANGTGVITPGNTSATSGTAVPVTPPNDTTTTYTLTVTGSSGATVSATTTVQAVAAPTITSFTAAPASVASGGSSNLTGVFANGTGVITPGTLAATTGTAVSVGPLSTTTTYTLTVTNAAGTAATQTATVTVTSGTSSVTVDPTSPGITVTDQILGMNMAAWYDEFTNAGSIISAFNGAGIKAIRWPGGSWSDDYHWGYQTGSSTLVAPYMCQSASDAGGVTGGWAGYGSFADFLSTIPLAGPYDLALTANYGTDEACTGGGDPNEAAAWVAAALTDGITPSHMTVGNEEYGSWETDLHAKPNDPTTYAAAVVGSNGYYKLIKAASPNTLVGVVVDANATNGCCTAEWDSTVLGNAAGSYDFVEFHFYAQNPGSESDSYLVTQAPQAFTQNIKTIQQELTTANEPNKPIYVGEMGSVSTDPGKQSWSITQGLYAGQMLGEMMDDGVSRATWWIGFGNCNGENGSPNGNGSSSLYGWQNFGAYNVFADGPGDTGGGSAGPPVIPATPCNYGGPIGTMSPTAQAFNLFQNVAKSGENVLTPTVTGDTTDVRAYAATHSGGTALVLFNLNETTGENVTVTVNGENSSADVQVITYDKSLYDQTDAATPVWAAPTTTDMGTQTIPLTLTLTPWSMNVVLIQ
ncbi:MAG: hypothetical protein WBE74_26350 [Terracidiphilus sp.]